MKHIIYLMIIPIFIMLTGCGSDNKTENNNENNESVTVNIQKKSFILEKIEVLNGDTFEAGRAISFTSTIVNETSSDENLSITYYLTDVKALKSKEVAPEGMVIGTDTLMAQKGSSSYTSNFILPTNLKTGKYQATAFIFSKEIAKLEGLDTLNDEEQSNYQRLYAEAEDNLSIKANDGKPDVEIDAISINNKDVTKVKKEELALATLPVVPFEIGVVDGKTILNNKERVFHGTIDIIDYIADATNIKASACIEVDGVCEDIKFYLVNDKNQSVEEADFVVDSVKFQERRRVLFNAYVPEELLKKIAKNVLVSQTAVTKLKVTLFGIEQSATEDVAKNSIEGELKFSPVVLSRLNVDNNKDVIAQFLPIYQLKSEDYIIKLNQLSQKPKVASGLTEIKSNPTVSSPTLNPALNPNLNPALYNAGILQVDDVKVQDLHLTPVAINTDNLSAVTLGDIHLAPIGSLDFSDVDYDDVSTEAEKLFSQDYEFREVGDYFGVDAKLSALARFNRQGVEGVGNGFIKTKLFGYWLTPLNIDSYTGVKPTKFADTGYDFTVEVMGIAVYTQSDDIVKHYKLHDSTASSEGQKAKENIEKVDNYITTNSVTSLFSYEKDMFKIETISKSKTFTVGPVPITVAGFISGRLGLKVKVEIPGIKNLVASATPYGNLRAGASGGVGVSGCSTGLKGELTLIEESFIAKVTGTIEFVKKIFEDKIVLFVGTLEETITNRLVGPHGRVSIYYDYPYADICYTKHTHWYCGYHRCPYPCGGCKEGEYNLASFSSGTYEKVLLDKKQTLFRVRLP